jgi:hypothetical protein
MSEFDIEITLKYGEKRRWFHGAFIYYLGKRALAAALINEPALRYQAQRLEGSTVLTWESSGQVITVFKDKRGLRQIFKNYQGRSRKRADVDFVPAHPCPGKNVEGGIRWLG